MPVDDAPDLTLSAETLGSLYLGGVRVGSLADAGRVTGDPDAVARLGRLLDGGPAPYALTSFSPSVLVLAGAALLEGRPSRGRRAPRPCGRRRRAGG